MKTSARIRLIAIATYVLPDIEDGSVRFSIKDAHAAAVLHTIPCLSETSIERGPDHGDRKGLTVLPKDLRGVGPDSASLPPVLLEPLILGAVARFASPAQDDQHREVHGAFGLIERGIGEVLEHLQSTVHAAR